MEEEISDLGEISNEDMKEDWIFYVLFTQQRNYYSINKKTDFLSENSFWINKIK